MISFEKALKLTSSEEVEREIKDRETLRYIPALQFLFIGIFVEMIVLEKLRFSIQLEEGEVLTYTNQ